MPQKKKLSIFNVRIKSEEKNVKQLGEMKCGSISISTAKKRILK